MTIKQAVYDIDTNDWLSNVVRELNLQDAYNATADDRAVKDIIKSRTQAAAEEKALERARYTEDAFDETIVDFVAVRFVKKYKGADTSVAMKTLVEQKRVAERKYTGMMQRRQKINKRKYEEQAFKKVRAMRRMAQNEK